MYKAGFTCSKGSALAPQHFFLQSPCLYQFVVSFQRGFIKHFQQMCLYVPAFLSS